MFFKLYTKRSINEPGNNINTSKPSQIDQLNGTPTTNLLSSATEFGDIESLLGHEGVSWEVVVATNVGRLRATRKARDDYEYYRRNQRSHEQQTHDQIFPVTGSKKLFQRINLC
ncbi:hypothetical protein TWF718_003477 [Orbilia javanica]|uniref:Uncharacterized protein n=1 Tax=Orbilia javanica TaxID=47235 RepID=A0AAN8MM15_9PEZI